MPNYVTKQLIKYKHPKPKCHQACRFEPNPVHYGKKSDEIIPKNESTPLNDNDKKYIQQVVGSFYIMNACYWHGHLNGIEQHCNTTIQTNRKTMERIRRLLDYMYSNTNTIRRLWVLDMILNVHSDASYLSATRGQSCTGSYFFLGSLPKDKELIQLNGNIKVTCAILKLVTESAAEAELGEFFLNAQQVKVVHLILHKLRHP